jgi:hypothetical protein
MMHMLTKSTVVLGFAGVMAMSAPVETRAQGIYFQGPGVEFGIGRPYRERYYRYYDYDRPTVYGRTYYDSPYVEDRRYYRRRGWDRY